MRGIHAESVPSGCSLRDPRAGPDTHVHGIAILTLALGIGANTAIFTVVNALLLRPLPYGAPDRLVMVWQDLRARGGPADEWATPGNYADWRRETGLFQSVAVITGWRPTLTGTAEPEPVPGEQVSHEYLDGPRRAGRRSAGISAPRMTFRMPRAW